MRARALVQHGNSSSKPLNPSAPVIAGTPAIGNTLTITPGGGGGPVVSYQLYRDGILVGTVTNGYVFVSADIGPLLTVKALGPGGLSAASNVISFGLAARVASLNILRDFSNQTLSGAQISAWADAGGGTFGTLNGVISAPFQVRFLGKSALQFGNGQTTLMRAASSGTLNDLNGSGSFHRWYILRPDAGIQSEDDVRNCDQVFGDTNTYYSIGFQKAAGTIYLNGGYHNGTAWKQVVATPSSAPNAQLACTQGAWILVEEKWDSVGKVYSLQVGNNAAQSVSVGGTGVPAFTGGIDMGRNWQTEYANFSIAAVVGAKAIQSAGVVSDVRAYLTNLYLSRVDYTPVLADLWGNGDTSTRFNYPVYSSEAMLVGDTNASYIVPNLTIFSQTIDASNNMEFNVAVGVGSDSPTHWTTLAANVNGLSTDGTGYMVVSLPPIALPGTGTRRVWVISPAHGTGIFYEVQSLQLSPGSTWTPVPQPSSGALLALETMGGSSLGNSNFFGWYYINGVRQDAGYLTARNAVLGHLAQAIAGQSPGTILLYSPQTNDFRNGTSASDAALQAQLLVSDVKAAAPGWKVLYYSLLPLTNFATQAQAAWSTSEMTGAWAGGADKVVDGQTIQTLADIADNTHPYLTGTKKSYDKIVSDVRDLGRSGKMIWMLGNSLACGSAMYSPQRKVYVNPNIEGLPGMLRLNGW